MSGIVAPALASLRNTSILAGVLPQSQKHAQVNARLKKNTLNPDDMYLYRPISSLFFASKLVKSAVASRSLVTVKKQPFPNQTVCLPQVPFDWDGCHNCLQWHCLQLTELTALVLLDLSSAFDTVDHSCLISVLRQQFNIEGLASDWFTSYLTGRSQTLCTNMSQFDLINN